MSRAADKPATALAQYVAASIDYSGVGYSAWLGGGSARRLPGDARASFRADPRRRWPASQLRAGKRVCPQTVSTPPRTDRGRRAWASLWSHREGPSRSRPATRTVGAPPGVRGPEVHKSTQRLPESRAYDSPIPPNEAVEKVFARSNVETELAVRSWVFVHRMCSRCAAAQPRRSNSCELH